MAALAARAAHHHRHHHRHHSPDKHNGEAAHGRRSSKARHSITSNHVSHGRRTSTAHLDHARRVEEHVADLASDPFGMDKAASWRHLNFGNPEKTGASAATEGGGKSAAVFPGEEDTLVGGGGGGGGGGGESKGDPVNPRMQKEHLVPYAKRCTWPECEAEQKFHCKTCDRALCPGHTETWCTQVCRCGIFGVKGVLVVPCPHACHGYYCDNCSAPKTRVIGNISLAIFIVIIGGLMLVLYFNTIVDDAPYIPSRGTGGGDNGTNVTAAARRTLRRVVESITGSEKMPA